MIRPSLHPHHTHLEAREVQLALLVRVLSFRIFSPRSSEIGTEGLKVARRLLIGSGTAWMKSTIYRNVGTRLTCLIRICMLSEGHLLRVWDWLPSPLLRVFSCVSIHCIRILLENKANLDDARCWTS